MLVCIAEQFIMVFIVVPMCDCEKRYDLARSLQKVIQPTCPALVFLFENTL